MSKPTEAKCPRCGATLPPSAPEGLCPRCLGALNLATDTVLTGADAIAAQPPLTPAELAPHFPQLEIIECLGRGGMGVVYRVRQKALNRLAALKLLAPERVTDAGFAERFTREAQALARLNHPNIVTIYDFGATAPPQTPDAIPHPPFYFLLMEFMDGVNLRQAMRTERFTPEQALAIVPPVCEALQYAHEQGIVHRDIKPENLLLDKNGRLKIADFGIAKILEPGRADLPPGQREEAAQQRGPTTQESFTAGTPGYMAPEQKSAPQRVDSRADIYSLGVVIYEMLTGELPAEKLQPPSRKVQIDVRLDEIVLRALEQRPELRFQTAADLRTQVETMVSTPDGSRRDDAQTSSTPPRFLKIGTSTLTTPEQLATAEGQVFCYRTRGQLILDDRQLTHSHTGTNTVIPLAAIRDLSIGQYPRSMNPAGVDLLSVTYEEGGQRKQVLLSPMEGFIGFPATFNARVAEWFMAIREATTAATGRAPGNTPAERLGVPGSSPLLLAVACVPLLISAGLLWMLMRGSGSSSGFARGALLLSVVALFIGFLVPVLFGWFSRNRSAASPGSSSFGKFSVLLMVLVPLLLFGFVILRFAPRHAPDYPDVTHFEATPVGVSNNVVIVDVTTGSERWSYELRTAFSGPKISREIESRLADPFLSSGSGTLVRPTPFAGNHPRNFLPGGRRQTTRLGFVLPTAELAQEAFRNLRPIGPLPVVPNRAHSGTLFELRQPDGTEYRVVLQVGLPVSANDPNWVSVGGRWLRGETNITCRWEVLASQPGTARFTREGDHSTSSLQLEPGSRHYRVPVHIELTKLSSDRVLLVTQMGGVTTREELPGDFREQSNELLHATSLGATTVRGVPIALWQSQGKSLVVTVDAVPVPVTTAVPVKALSGPAGLIAAVMVAGTAGIVLLVVLFMRKGGSAGKVVLLLVLLLLLGFGILQFFAHVRSPAGVTSFDTVPVGVSNNVVIVDVTTEVRRGNAELRAMLDGPQLSAAAEAALADAFFPPFTGTFIKPTPHAGNHPWRILSPGRQTWRLGFVLPDAALAKDAIESLHPVGPLPAVPDRTFAGTLFEVRQTNGEVFRASLQVALPFTSADPDWVSVFGHSKHNESAVTLNWEVLAAGPGLVHFSRAGTPILTLQPNSQAKLYGTSVQLELTKIGTNRVRFVRRTRGATATEEFPGNFRELADELLRTATFSAKATSGTKIELCRFQGTPFVVQVHATDSPSTYRLKLGVAVGLGVLCLLALVAGGIWYALRKRPGASPGSNAGAVLAGCLVLFVLFIGAALLLSLLWVSRNDGPPGVAIPVWSIGTVILPLAVGGIVLLIVLVRKGGSASKTVMLLCGVPLLCLAVFIAVWVLTRARSPVSATEFDKMELESNYPAPTQPNPPGRVQQTQNGFRLHLPAAQLASFEFFIRQADDSWQPVPSLTALVATGKDGGYHDTLHWTLRRSDMTETTNQLWFWTVSANANGGRPLPQLADHGTNFAHHVPHGEALDWWQLAVPASVRLNPGEQQIIPLFRTHGTATVRGEHPKEAFLRVRCEPLPTGLSVSLGQQLVEAGIAAHTLLTKALPSTTNGLTVRFSAVREFVLSVSGNRADFLDLDLGKVVAGTVGIADDLRSDTDASPFLKRVRAEGVDFGWATNYEGVVMPVCLDMGFFALPPDWPPTMRVTMGAFANVTNTWNDLRAESLKDWDDAMPKTFHIGLHIPTNFVGAPCIFETRNGTRGLLQMIEFTDNPRSVKIRYKLVQLVEAATTNAPAVAAIPQHIEFKALRAENPPGTRDILLHFERDTNYGLALEVSQDVTPSPAGRKVPAEGYRTWQLKNWLGVNSERAMHWVLPQEFTESEARAVAKDMEKRAKEMRQLPDGAMPEFATATHRDGWKYHLVARVKREVGSPHPPLPVEAELLGQRRLTAAPGSVLQVQLTANHNDRPQPPSSVTFKLATDQPGKLLFRWQAYRVERGPGGQWFVDVVNENSGVIFHRFSGGFAQPMKLSTPPIFQSSGKTVAEAGAAGRPALVYQWRKDQEIPTSAIGINAEFTEWRQPNLFRAEEVLAPGQPLKQWQSFDLSVRYWRDGVKPAVSPQFQLPATTGPRIFKD